MEVRNWTSLGLLPHGKVELWLKKREIKAWSVMWSRLKRLHPSLMCTAPSFQIPLRVFEPSLGCSPKHNRYCACCVITSLYRAQLSRTIRGISSWKWHICTWTHCPCWRGASDSAVISAALTFPLSHKSGDGESLIILYLLGGALTLPPPPRGEQKAALIQTDKLFDKKEERHNSICLGQARPRWGLSVTAASSAPLLLGGDKNRICWPLMQRLVPDSGCHSCIL